MDHLSGDVSLEWVFKPPSDTVIPYIRPFPGTLDRHPRVACRQRRAIGVPSFLPSWLGLCSRINVLSR
jgi:hypothetical protein